MARLLVLLMTAAAAAFPQRFSAGAKGGIPFTGFFNAGGYYSSKTNRYTLGPALELRLPRGLGLEINALYKRLHYSYGVFLFSASGTSVDISGKTTADRWEFPVLLKRRLPARAFVSGGLSLARVGNLDSRERACSKSLFDRDWRCGDRPGNEFQLQHRSALGFAGGGGVEIRAPAFRLVPEFRYTRWIRASFRDEYQGFGSNRNQAELLLGIMF